jgi:Bifunctional DNA primase/polymerase, N-terminal
VNALLDVAIRYVRRGWAVLPVPHASKDPGFRGWPELRLTERQLADNFNGQPQNIGVLLGEPSDWLVDVDLDHPRALELADQFLPPTPLVFGRVGKPRSHRLYRAASPVTTKKYKSKSAGMIVELRSTGTQTVFPPSTHEMGERICWDQECAEPAVVDPAELLDAVRKLAQAILNELGEGPAASSSKRRLKGQTTRAFKRGPAASCLAAMLRMTLVDQNDGSARLFAAACRTVEHNLADVEAIAAIREYARQRPFPQNWTDEHILARIRDAERKVPRGRISCAKKTDSGPKIVIDHEEHRVVGETVAALKQDSDLYQRAGILVRIMRDSELGDGIERSAGSATIGALPPASLRERMTKYAEFIKLVHHENAEVEIPAHPTAWLVAAVDARGDWPGIRRLTGISDVPILRPDGTLCQTPGYDPETRVVYAPARWFPRVPTAVPRSDAVAAMSRLLEVVCDFRFESDDHRAAWMSGLLTPLARFAFVGPAPLFLVDANVRGAGKGLLVQTIGWIVLGHEMPVSSYAHESEEMRKKVTSIALAGDRMVHLDNLEGRFGNDTLNRVLTATRWKDRMLGRNELVDLPLHAIWYGTGNNVVVADDTARRIIHIRLDVLEERPEERSDFRHPDLIGWIRDNRGQLLTDALAILVAYYQAGLPRQNLTPFGSYEGWSRVVREAIVWAGLPDPCLTRSRLTKLADTTLADLVQLIDAWAQCDAANSGLVISELIARLYPPQREAAPNDEDSVAMRVAIENFVGPASGRPPSARQLGNKLKNTRRRVANGRYLDTTETRRNGAVWRIWET